MKLHLPVALSGAAVLAAAAVLTLVPGAGAQAATASASNGTEAFTACVRAHGVADFPGVTETSDGRVLIDGTGAGTGFDPLSAAYQTAIKDCASKLPSGTALPTAPRLSVPSAPEVAVNGAGSGWLAAPKAPAAPVPPS